MNAAKNELQETKAQFTRLKDTLGQDNKELEAQLNSERNEHRALAQSLHERLDKV